MTWDVTIDLISVSHSDDANVIVNETIRTIYADKKSVDRREFYTGIANGLKPTAIFEVHEFEYEDEQKLRHEGKDYLITRTYSKGDDKVDLICMDFDDVQTNLARLRDTVEIWQQTFTENSMLELEPTTSLLYSVKAEIEYKGGGTGESDTITETTQNAIVSIVYREGIREDMHLKINGKRWDIRFIEDPLNRHETLILTVERVTP